MATLWGQAVCQGQLGGRGDGGVGWGVHEGGDFKEGWVWVRGGRECGREGEV